MDADVSDETSLLKKDYQEKKEAFLQVVIIFSVLMLYQSQ